MAYFGWNPLRERPRSKLPWFLLLVLLVHVWILRQNADWVLTPARTAKLAPIEIDKLSDLPVVQTERLKNSKKGKAEFAGEFDQHTDKQTRSPRSGDFQRGGGGSSSAQDHLAQQAPEPEDSVGEPSTQSQRSSLRALMGFSATPNKLPDSIDLGEATVLNTQEVSYASFLNRVSEEIYQPWVHYANQAVEEIYLVGGKLSPQAYITKIVVSLNEDGDVIAIQTAKSSGVEALDNASRQAFWDQENFRNPPVQMKGADGVFRFGCDFQFEWRTSSFRVAPWAI
ncbi:TonB C-terminal domain-containing protein [bacterium]|nr:TonB C-terminal domain-containing protein [bacterium]